MIASFARQSVVRLRAGVVTDRYGNEAADWSSPSRLTISPVIVQPAAGAEMFDVEGGKLITRWALHANLGADITAEDRIEYEGEVYGIDGAVQVYQSPSGNLDHLEMLLERVDPAHA